MNIIFLLNTVFLFFVARSYEYRLNHIVLFYFSFLIFYCGSQLFYNEFGFDTKVYLNLSLFTFALCSYRPSLKRDNPTYDSICCNDKYLKCLKNIAYFMFVANIILSLTTFYTMLSSGFSLEAFSAFRKDGDIEDAIESQGIIYTLLSNKSFVYIPLFLLLNRIGRIPKKTVFVVFATTLFLSILSMRRGPLLFLMIEILVSYHIIFTKRRINTRLLFFMLGIVLVFFFASSMFLSNNVLESIKLYLFAGGASYDNIVRYGYVDNAYYDIKLYSLDFLLNIISKFNDSLIYPSIVREYNSLYLTNVYTFLDGATIDFGMLGVVAISAIYAYIGRYLYTKSSNIFALILYSLFCAFCSLTFMCDFLFRFSTLFSIIVVFILYYISSLFTKIKIR